MNRPDYSISTPENVDLHLELAGLGSRIWAAFIDMALIYLVLLLIVIVAIIGATIIAQSSLSPEMKGTIYTYMAGIAIFIVFAMQFGYFMVFEKVWKGQTPGKRIAQIRVIEANGQPANWPSVLIRNLLRFVDMIAMIGVVFMVFDRNERRIGDLLGGTLVIRERQPELSARNLRLTAHAPDESVIDPGQIKPDEYHLLASFLRRRHAMDVSSRSVLARQLADYFRSKLAPENKGESAEILLEKIYLAYGGSASSGSASNGPASSGPEQPEA